jgi:hypothetical protein
MSFSLDQEEDDDCTIVANIVAPTLEEDILLPSYSKVIVSNGELLEKLKDAIQGVNDAKNRLLLELYYDLQVETHVRREYRLSSSRGERKCEWFGVTPENQMVFSQGVQMLIYEGLDRALFNRMFYPFTMHGDKQPPPPPLEEEFNISSDEDRVNNVILKWREYCTNSIDFIIPVTKF